MRVVVIGATGNVGTSLLLSLAHEPVFTVTLSEPSGRPLTVDYASVDGTAVSGTDYRAVPQTR